MSPASAKAKRSNPALRFAFLRQLHVYISVFVAPSLLLFAVTGALQTFRIPDRPDAPPLLVKLARVHKDDVFAPKPVHAPKPAGADAEGGHKHHEGAGAEGASKAPQAQPAKAAPKPATTVLKWFFSLGSIGIAITTLFGLWMALAYNRRKLIMLGVLAAGAAAPVLILMAAA